MQFGASKGWAMHIAAPIAALAMGLASAAWAQKTELLVYTALETDQIKAYEDAFYKAYPDISIKWVRDSTGVITAKLLAEKANPQADMVVGTSASSLAVFANEGMLQPYAPGLQGQDRDAESRVVGHGLPRCRGLAADVGRGRRVEVHGCAPRKRRALHPLGLEAVP